MWKLDGKKMAKRATSTKLKIRDRQKSGIVSGSERMGAASEEGTNEIAGKI